MREERHVLWPQGERHERPVSSPSLARVPMTDGTRARTERFPEGRVLPRFGYLVRQAMERAWAVVRRPGLHVHARPPLQSLSQAESYREVMYSSCAKLLVSLTSLTSFSVSITTEM